MHPKAVQMILKLLFVSCDKVIAICTAVCQRLLSVQYTVLKGDHYFVQFAEQGHQLRDTELFRINTNAKLLKTD